MTSSFQNFGTTIKPRRTRVFLISTGLLIDLMKGTDEYWRVPKGQIPDDARVVGVAYDTWMNAWNVVLESKDFPEIGEGASIVYTQSILIESFTPEYLANLATKDPEQSAVDKPRIVKITVYTDELA